MMSSLERAVLARAAHMSLGAPSVFNTQPWRWVVDDALTLYTAHDRQLRTADPAGRMLLTSCGAALHHARVALAAAGWETTVTRRVGVGRPEFDRDETLATVRLVGQVAPSPRYTALAAAIPCRHTDRRPYAEELPDEAMLAIRVAVEAEGLRVHRVRWDQLLHLRHAAEQAINAELANAAYRAELRLWTNRDTATGDGVPPETVIRQVSRAVPTRPFAVDPDAGLPAPDGGDTHSSYLILFGPGDDRGDWLRAGEALSAALLTATVHGVAAAPMSDLIEVPATRAHMRSMLAGMGYPHLVLRCGSGAMGAQPGHAPRRAADETIEEH